MITLDIARLLTHSGQFKAGLAEYRKIVLSREWRTSLSTDPRVLLEYADLLRAVGQGDEAKAVLATPELRQELLPDVPRARAGAGDPKGTRTVEIARGEALHPRRRGMNGCDSPERGHSPPQLDRRSSPTPVRGSV